MRLLKLQLLAAALAAALAAPALAAQPTRPPVVWEPSPNFNGAHRKPGDIRYIVIHTTQGPADGAVSWFENDASRVSAHFVIDRAGNIVQLVRVHNIAWHAGNWPVNRTSIGIEHAGIVGDPGGYTDAEYRASARLVAWLCRTYDVPIDRNHIIGHNEVPDPNNPTLFGGVDQHTDPGPYWDWTTYMRLVRQYAGVIRVLPQVRISGVTVGHGGVLSGYVAWRANATRGVQRVDFRVDGNLVFRDTSRPFELPRLNTAGLTNGRHVLEVHAYGRHGIDVWRKQIRIYNRPFVLGASGVSETTPLSGAVAIRPRASASIRSVSLVVDGRTVATRARPPFVLAWDSRGATNGAHDLQLVARARDGRVARKELTVNVFNRGPAAHIAGSSLTAGQSVNGVVSWQITVQGPAQRVEFLVDGMLRSTRTFLPFVFQWDTAEVAPGPHTLTARVIQLDGTPTELSVPVTVTAN